MAKLKRAAGHVATGVALGAVSLGLRGLALAHQESGEAEAHLLREDDDADACVWRTIPGRGPICITSGHGHTAPLGTVDPKTGKKVLQPANDVTVLVTRAERARADYDAMIQGLAGEFDAQSGGVRVKAAGPGTRLDQKLKGRNPENIGDYLAGRVVFERPEDIDRFVKALQAKGMKIIEDENFLNKPKFGYRARHLEVLLKGKGITAEMQLIPVEIWKVQEEAHKQLEVLQGRTGASQQEIEQAQAKSVQIFEGGWAKQLARAAAQSRTPARVSVAAEAGGALRTSARSGPLGSSTHPLSPPQTSTTPIPSRPTTRASRPSTTEGGQSSFATETSIAEAADCRWVTLSGRHVCITGGHGGHARGQAPPSATPEITSATIEQHRGGVTTTPLDHATTWDVFDRAAFEALGPQATLLPLDKLVSTKNELLDPKFLAGQKADPRITAIARMADAAAGTIPRRAPLTVVQRADGRYVIQDGNATAQALMLAGKTHVPAQILQPGTQQEAADDCHWITKNGLRICITPGHGHAGASGGGSEETAGHHLRLRQYGWQPVGRQGWMSDSEWKLPGKAGRLAVATDGSWKHVGRKGVILGSGSDLESLNHHLTLTKMQTTQEATDDCHWVTIGGRRICITAGHGHAGAGSSAAPPYPRPGAHEAALTDRLRAPDGGFTYNPTTNSEPTRGYAVSPYPDRSKVLQAGDLTEEDLTGYIVKNWDLLQQPGHHLGAWHDPKTGKVYLDISVVKNSAKAAKALALKRDQIAYFDLAKGVSVDVNRAAKSGQAA